MCITFHFITVVWGDAYTDLFLDVVMPTQLSPGNLGAFADKSAIYKIYTTSKDAAKICASDIFHQLKERISVEVITDDEADLSKGFQVMIDFHNRAIQEADRCSATLIFLTPDSIWSDGTFLRLWELATAGKRVVLSTGTRLTKETFVPDFLQQFRPHQEYSVTLPPRVLVNAALPHLHPTTKSLFLNDRCSNSWPSLLYWHAPDGGILARCFHLHPIMINPLVKGVIPKSSVDDDYIAAVCPNADDFYVIEDSDEIIGFEISSQHHLVGEMVPSEPTALQIAVWAYYFANDRHQEFVNHRILIHDGNLSPQWQKTIHQSDEFLRSIQHYIRVDLKRLDKLLYSLKPMMIFAKDMVLYLRKMYRSFKRLLRFLLTPLNNQKAFISLRYKPSIHYTIGMVRSIMMRSRLTRWLLGLSLWMKSTCQMFKKASKVCFKHVFQKIKRVSLQFRAKKPKTFSPKKLGLKDWLLKIAPIKFLLTDVRYLVFFVIHHPTLRKR